jgi:hypothetical protein
MKRLSTILCLLFVANSLFAQKKSQRTPQYFLSIETGAPILNTTYQNLPIPLNIEYQRQKKQWGFGASLALQYNTYSSGDCSKRIPVGTYLYIAGYFSAPYNAYCETSQYLAVKPSLFSSYYFLQKKKYNLFAKLGGIANIPVFTHKKGEFYEIDVQINGGTTIQVINSGPIHISGKVKSNRLTHIGLLSGLGGNYFLNKRTALRFSLQSEWYSGAFKDNTDSGLLLFALAGVMIKI